MRLLLEGKICCTTESKKFFLLLMLPPLIGKICSTYAISSLLTSPLDNPKAFALLRLWTPILVTHTCQSFSELLAHKIQWPP